VIRQAISCDICATEKRQTNHWFVAYEQAGELRISDWNSRHRQRTDSKHLCGQICLHKLVDEFTAKSIAVRQQRTADTNEAAHKMPAVADASLTSNAAFAKPGWGAGIVGALAHAACAHSAQTCPPSPARTCDLAVAASS
jgi:hypothetical protein